jgi:hypothetical protein
MVVVFSARWIAAGWSARAPRDVACDLHVAGFVGELQAARTVAFHQAGERAKQALLVVREMIHAPARDGAQRT